MRQHCPLRQSPRLHHNGTNIWISVTVSDKEEAFSKKVGTQACHHCRAMLGVILVVLTSDHELICTRDAERPMRFDDLDRSRISKLDEIALPDPHARS
ncbi:hypothetical protein D3C72_1998450 [compost metagenome]